jgi:RNA polymerase primary sigma factor
VYWIGKQTDLMPSKDQLELLRKYKIASPEEAVVLRNQLVSASYGLVLKLAAGYEKAYYLNSEDLFKEGVLGLCKAIDKFDPKHGTKFNTYATYWVNLYLIQFIKKNSKLVTMTEYANNQLTRLKKEDHAKLKTKWGEYKYSEIRNLSNPEGERNSSDVIKDDNSFLSKIKLDNCRDVINGIIKTFSVKEKVILRCRFSLNNGKRLKLEEIGRPYKVTKECIRQIERKAIGKLKKRLIKIGVVSIGEMHD